MAKPYNQTGIPSDKHPLVKKAESDAGMHHGTAKGHAGGADPDKGHYTGHHPHEDYMPTKHNLHEHTAKHAKIHDGHDGYGKGHHGGKHRKDPMHSHKKK